MHACTLELCIVAERQVLFFFCIAFSPGCTGHAPCRLPRAGRPGHALLMLLVVARSCMVVVHVGHLLLVLMGRSCMVVVHVAHLLLVVLRWWCAWWRFCIRGWVWQHIMVIVVHIALPRMAIVDTVPAAPWIWWVGHPLAVGCTTWNVWLWVGTLYGSLAMVARPMLCSSMASLQFWQQDRLGCHTVLGQPNVAQDLSPFGPTAIIVSMWSSSMADGTRGLQSADSNAGKSP